MTYLWELNEVFEHDEINKNSALDFMERTAGRILFAEDIIITGTGTVNLNVFKINGTIRVLNSWAEITEVTTLNNLTDLYSDVWDGTNSVALTKTSGVSLSGAPVGTFFTKDKASAETYSVALANEVRVLEATTKNAVPFYITQKHGVDTFIRLNFNTTDTPVNFKLSVWFEYIPINGGSIVIV